MYYGRRGHQIRSVQLRVSMSSSSEEDFIPRYKGKKKKTIHHNAPKTNINNAYNVVHKLFNRELYGSTTRNDCRKNRKILEKIPGRLRFCLMEIVPPAYLDSHVFMGFSQCGQFLISFTYEYVLARECSKFDLHFLLWSPGQTAMPVHRVTLFGDDSVDTRVSISIAQWKHNPGVLVAYGIGESPSERSYLSIIGVPRLSCLKCAAYVGVGDYSYEGFPPERCLEHNFAIHTRFFCASDSSMYEPVVQLAYYNQIIIYTDYIHILEIDLVESNHDIVEENVKNTPDKEDSMSTLETSPSTPASDVSLAFQSPKYQNVAVQNILADFSDLEVEPYQLSKPVQLPDVMGQELCIQASSIAHNLVEEWEGSSPSIRTLISPPLRSPRRRPAESMTRFNESHRMMAEKTYEFVEEADTKCEKLSMFRKRRLADKKYEFSEDNNENIVPFRVLRSKNKYFIGSSNNKSSPRRAKSPAPETVVLRTHNYITPAAVATTSYDEKGCLETDLHSESEYRITEMLDDGSMKTVSIHDNTSKTLSDCKVNPQDPYLVHSENSKCSKFFTRYFVESDDEITSILTDSEDDCFSGYHVALHLSAHGAGSVPLQTVSAAAFDRLRRTTEVAPLTLRAQQRSLDMELFCNEVCERLCILNGMKFIYCFDWGCHVIDVCPSSGCLSGVCAMWLWASDKDNTSECEICKVRNCLLHRRQFAAECLFTWDIVSGVYRTESVSITEDSSNDVNRVSGADRASELAKKLGPINMPPGSETRILTTLIGRSLKKLTDLDHCIEITKHHPYKSDSESSCDDYNFD